MTARAEAREHARLPARPATDGRHDHRFARIARAAGEYRYDASRFLRHSAAIVPRRMASLRALVTMDAHRIEKGLSVPAPQPWSGRTTAERLARNIDLYQRFSGDRETIHAAVEALREYLNRHTASQPPPPDWAPALAAQVAALRPALTQGGGAGGTTTVTRRAIQRGGALASPDFFTSRHTIRDFAAEPVTWQELMAAVRSAQTTPSVCNRQSWRVQAFPRGAQAEAVLACQNGNSGFGHTASHVLVISADLRAFVYLGERNQAWIDGGMFAMSLIYAFHAAGLGTCCLNWSVESAADRRLRAVTDIPDWEVVIMMLAVGRLPETLRVTRSHRRPEDTVLRVGACRSPAGSAPAIP